MKSYSQEDRINTQIVKFFIVGVTSNGISYILYLIATMFLGFGHKMAMTVLYASGMALSFYINRKWTFRSAGAIRRSAGRFIIVYVLGYIINLFLLFFFVDLGGFPHQLIQAFAIVFMAAYFFAVNKWYVHAQ